MIKIKIKLRDIYGNPYFNEYETEDGFIFDKDLGWFNSVEYIFIREVKDE